MHGSGLKTFTNRDFLDYREQKEADAAFYRQKREAEGLIEMAKGYGALVDVLGGPQAFLQYKMMESGTYEKLAKANGLAINGLQPRITMWNTGTSKLCLRSFPITAPCANI